MPELPVNFVSDISSNATDMIASLSGVATLIIGVLLAGVVLNLIIHAIKK
jgi:cobyrinic acid a,c-diamide synthase